MGQVPSQAELVEITLLDRAERIRGMFYAMFDTLDGIYDVKEQRGITVATGLLAVRVHCEELAETLNERLTALRATLGQL